MTKTIAFRTASPELRAFIKDWLSWASSKAFPASNTYTGSAKRASIYESSRGLCEAAHRCYAHRLENTNLSTQIITIMEERFGQANIFHHRDYLSGRPYYLHTGRVIFFSKLINEGE